MIILQRAGDGEPADEEHDKPADLESRRRRPSLCPRLRSLHCERLRPHVGENCDNRMMMIVITETCVPWLGENRYATVETFKDLHTSCF